MTERLTGKKLSHELKSLLKEEKEARELKKIKN